MVILFCFIIVPTSLLGFVFSFSGSYIFFKFRRSMMHLINIAEWASLIAQLVKNLPAMQETPVRFLGWEDPLEKGQATHSSILGFPLWFNW